MFVAVHGGSVDFQNYLRSLATYYAAWQNFYTPTDAEGKEKIKQQQKALGSPLDSGLMVQSKPPEWKPEEDITQAAQKILQYTQGFDKTTFLADDKTQSALFFSYLLLEKP